MTMGTDDSGATGVEDTLPVLFTFTVLCILISLYIIYTISTFKGRPNLPTLLIKHVHHTLLIRFFSSLPYVFSHPGALCNTAGFFVYFGGLSNALVILWMNIAYRQLLISDLPLLYEFLRKHMFPLIYLFPCLLALPFITNSYGEAVYSGDDEDGEDRWCSLDNSKPGARMWDDLLHLLPMVLLLAAACGVLAKTLYDLYGVEKELALKLIRTSGAYTLISVLSWIPTLVPRTETMLHIYISLYFSIWCLLYLVLFLYEKEGLQQYQLYEESLEKDEVSSTNDSMNAQSAEGFELSEGVDVRRSASSGNSGNSDGSCDSSVVSGGEVSSVATFEKPGMIMRAIATENAAVQMRVSAYTAATAASAISSDGTSSVDTAGKLANAMEAGMKSSGSQSHSIDPNAVSASGTRKLGSYHLFMRKKIATEFRDSSDSSQAAQKQQHKHHHHQSGTSVNSSSIASGMSMNSTLNSDSSAGNDSKSKSQKTKRLSAQQQPTAAAKGARDVQVMESHREISRDDSVAGAFLATKLAAEVPAAATAAAAKRGNDDVEQATRNPML